MNPPVLPMLAKRVGELPSGDTWIFEPKWDGFRALIVSGWGEILIQSRDEKPLNRYFPELSRRCAQLPPAACWMAKSSSRERDGLDFRFASTPASSGGVAGKLFPNKFPLPSSSSTCFARETATCAANHSSSGKNPNHLLSSASRPFTFTPATTDRASRQIGFAASKARAWTV